MSVRDRQRVLFGRGDSTERLEFFSDAVFAIAMTLLVLDIRLPDTEVDDLGRALQDLLPEFFAYALSFVLIAGNWIGHHRTFRVITGYDGKLIRLNLLLLFLITFLPFPTSVLSDYGGETPAVVLYAATVASISLMQIALLAYAHRAGLLSKAMDQGVYRSMTRGGLVAPAVFVASILIALVSPVAAMYSWIAIAPVAVIVDRFTDRAERAG